MVAAPDRCGDLGRRRARVRLARCEPLSQPGPPASGARELSGRRGLPVARGAALRSAPASPSGRRRCVPADVVGVPRRSSVPGELGGAPALAGRPALRATGAGRRWGLVRCAVRNHRDAALARSGPGVPPCAERGPVLRIEASRQADTPDECRKGEEVVCRSAVIDRVAVFADLTDGPVEQVYDRVCARWGLVKTSSGARG